MLDTLLKQYADIFKDNYPIFFARHLDEAEITELIIRAIDKNEPFIPLYSIILL